MRVVTDFNVFDIGLFVLFFYYLPFYECWSAQLLFINITGTTSVWDYQCMSSACRLYWCLILQMAASAPLYSTSSPQEVNIHMLLCYISNYHRSLQYCLSLLTRSYTLISDPPYWLPVIQCLFCVCFSHCTKLKKKNKRNQVKGTFMCVCQKLDHG